MSQLPTKNLELNKKRWHRLIMVSFIIVTIAWIALAISISDWYFRIQTFFNIFIGVIIWLTITNLVYYEWIVYVITGEYWNSFYRKTKSYYNKLAVEKRKKIIKIIGIYIGWLIIIKLIIFPIVSNYFSDIGNSIYDNANQRRIDWWEYITTKEKNKVQKYCNISVFMNKSSKTLRCLWNLTYINDSFYAAESYYQDALNHNPNLEDKIKIMIDMAWAQHMNKDDYSAKNTLKNLIPLINDENTDYYNFVSLKLYMYLWELADNYNDARQAFYKAESFAKTDLEKYIYYYIQAGKLSNLWYYAMALQLISEMRRDIWTRMTAKQITDTVTLESEIKGNYSNQME